ncbi:MAG: hypothetical protein HY269_05220 [Deltaproteobacteria bacterium]|nr:hypothetical protein [Deltaproteobacteria bacterium]
MHLLVELAIALSRTRILRFVVIAHQPSRQVVGGVEMGQDGILEAVEFI